MTASTLDRGETVLATEDTASKAPAQQGDADETRVVLLRDVLRESSRIPSPWHRPLQSVAWLMKAGIGLCSLVALLALAASIPVVNLIALGYLMEVQSRVARTGKFRSAFYLLPATARLAGIVLGVTLWLLPIKFLAGIARDSWVLAPGGTVTWLWTAGLVVASFLIATHLLLAICCGGGWWRFVRPLSNIRRFRAHWRSGEYWPDAHHVVYEFVAAFRLLQLMRRGVLAYAAVYIWLVVPTLLFTSLDDPTSRWQIVIFVVGCVTLTLTLLWLPLLLAHVAAEGRWRAMLEFTTVRELAGQSPFGWAIATALLLACSILPMLYTALLKNRLPPHDVRWDLMLVFLVTAVPARVLLGWVYHRATLRTRSAPSWPWRIWQGANGVALTIGIGWYVYFLYLAETGGELGQRAVWQFHALLLPWPF